MQASLAACCLFATGLHIVGKSGIRALFEMRAETVQKWSRSPLCNYTINPKTLFNNRNFYSAVFYLHRPRLFRWLMEDSWMSGCSLFLAEHSVRLSLCHQHSSELPASEIKYITISKLVNKIK